MVCKVCSHPRLDAIEQALRRGARSQDLAAEFGIGRSAFDRHRGQHMVDVVASQRSQKGKTDRGVLRAADVYGGSDGVITRRYLKALSASSPLGPIAAELFRAQKPSSRAKRYRGGPGRSAFGSFSDFAYDRKGKALRSLCKLLGAQDALEWGWGDDPERGMPVLYVELPEGQVSFHSTERFDGPDYPKDWDGSRNSEARILRFCDSLLPST